MPIKKSELYATIWKSCDALRGGMDASQYKDYVLVLLFVRYVTDKYGGQPDALVDIPPGASFADMVALRGDPEIGDKMNKIVAKLAEANNLGTITDVDFNDPTKLGDGKQMVDRLSDLVGIFNDPALDFSANHAEGDDLLGDAYEYLMRHFATESGKSKGQFYTPAEVSRVMARIIGVAGATRGDQSIHDPTCGSGSLLLKAHDEAKSRTGLDLALYGQEMDNATATLAKMNMYLHAAPSAEIRQGNTLANPHFLDPVSGALKHYDFVVANPPFSTKAWTTGFDPAHDPFHRFTYGIPPPKNGDYAFLLHVLACLKSTGTGAIILPHGVLFRGGAEATIRRAIVQRGYIKGIIGLPANLFYGTGIPACIVVLDKRESNTRTGIFMVDASKGFMKDGPKNRLRAQDIHRIVDTFTKQRDVDRYARMVPLAEIEANDYNLNLPRYIDSTEPEDIQDIDAHLRGGIPDRDLDALAPYWSVLPGLRAELFTSAGRPGYSALTLPIAEVKPAIFQHPEFTAFTAAVTARFDQWREQSLPALSAIAPGDHPKALIESLSESLLQSFTGAPLLDPYAVYQHLMDLWEGEMQDDVYLIVQEGWSAVQGGKPNIDLIPQTLVVTRYFAAEREQIARLEAERDAIARQMEELDEEHSGEDGLLTEAKNEKGKLTKVSVRAHLKELTQIPMSFAATTADDADEETVDERALLTAYFALIDKEAAASKQVKDATAALTAKVTARYATLTESDVQALVIEDKWLAALAQAIQSEVDRVSQALTGRIRQLAERYATPLPQLTEEAACLAARVEEHLQKMMRTVWA